MKMKKKTSLLFDLEPLPSNQSEAVDWLMTLVKASDEEALRDVPLIDFRRGWFAIGFLYPGLHPDSAAEHGFEVSNEVDDVPEIRKVEPRLLAPFLVQSGWPVLLVPTLKEAWMRFEANELNEAEFYCSEAVIAGMCYRNPALLRQVTEERSRSQF